MKYVTFSFEVAELLARMKQTEELEWNSDVRIAREAFESTCQMDPIAGFLAYDETKSWPSAREAGADYRKVAHSELPSYVEDTFRKLKDYVKAVEEGKPIE